MKIARSAAGLFGLAMLFWFVDVDRAQPPPGPRPPPPQAPVTRAVPAEETPEAPSAETEQPEKRQLEYANALFTRKLYDLAIPEYQNTSTIIRARPDGRMRISRWGSATAI